MGLIDPVLIVPFRMRRRAMMGFSVGALCLCLLAVVLGELTLSAAIRLNRRHLQDLKDEISHMEELSIQAYAEGDRTATRPSTRHANDAWGRYFFTMAAYSAGMLWPVPFALAWMQTRFQGVEFELVWPLNLLIGDTWATPSFLSRCTFSPALSSNTCDRGCPISKGVQAMRDEKAEQRRRLSRAFRAVPLPMPRRGRTACPAVLCAIRNRAITGALKQYQPCTEILCHPDFSLSRAGGWRRLAGPGGGAGRAGARGAGGPLYPPGRPPLFGCFDGAADLLAAPAAAGARGRLALYPVRGAFLHSLEHRRVHGPPAGRTPGVVDISPPAGGWSASMPAIPAGTGMLYYAAKLDHLLCVPAMLFLYFGLRRLLKAAGQRRAGQARHDRLLLPILVVDVGGSVLMIVLSFLCIGLVRRLRRRDPQNVVWTYLFWVCLGLAGFRRLAFRRPHPQAGPDPLAATRRPGP